jgi:phosphatidylinositol N-acetylglucosaminyltransferase subunit P
MAPQSRGLQSKSTPNLPTTVNPFDTDPHIPLSPSTAATSPSDAAASVEDNVDPIADPDDFQLTTAGDSDDASSSASSTSNPDADDFAANHARHSPNAPDATPAANHGGRSLPARPSFYAHSSRSHSHLPPHPALFPPFYNRPPTPLPPSPSLTSLLRPSFSTTTSRPTTPDSSDVETPFAPGVGGSSDAGTRRPGSSSAATVSSYRTQATGGGGGGGPRGSVSSIGRGSEEGPVPPTAPRVPTYESYGFAVYLFSSLAFLVYVLWAYVPSPILHSLGITYYPNRWWALAVPAWLVLGIVYIYFALASYNTGYLTLKLDSLEVLVDEVSRVAPLGAKDQRKDGSLSVIQRREVDMGDDGEIVVGNDSARQVPWAELWNEGTDAVLDVPAGGVCEILYGYGREPDEDEVDGLSDERSSAM